MWPCHSPGRPSSWPSHESVSSSSSVTAGEVRQSMPLAFIVAASSSARMPGCDAVIAEVGEEARVVPVRDARACSTRSRSASTSANGSASSGGEAGRPARISPGSTVDITWPLADALEVVGRPVDRGVAVGPELLRIRHAGRLACARGRDRGRTPRSPRTSPTARCTWRRRRPMAGDGLRPERHRPARAVGRRPLGQLVAVETGAPAAADGLRAGRAGRGHDRAGAVRPGTAAIGASTFVILLAATPSPIARRELGLGRHGAVRDLRRWSRHCSSAAPMPTAPRPMTCPAQPVPPSATNRAVQAITLAGVNTRRARLMLPPSLVVAYRIWGDRHSFLSR